MRHFAEKTCSFSSSTACIATRQSRTQSPEGTARVESGAWAGTRAHPSTPSILVHGRQTDRCASSDLPGPASLRLFAPCFFVFCPLLGSGCCCCWSGPAKSGERTDSHTTRHNSIKDSIDGVLENQFVSKFHNGCAESHLVVQYSLESYHGALSDACVYDAVWSTASK